MSKAEMKTSCQWVSAPVPPEHQCVQAEPSAKPPVPERLGVPLVLLASRAVLAAILTKLDVHAGEARKGHYGSGAKKILIR